MSANFEPFKVTGLSPLKAPRRLPFHFPRLAYKNTKTPRMRSSLNHTVELPIIKRYKTPTPIKNLSLDWTSPSEIDLEKLHQLETSLWNIYTKLDVQDDVSPAVKQYWEGINDSFMGTIEDFFKEQRSKQQVRVSFIIEFGSIWILDFCSKNTVIWSYMFGHLKSLIYQIHQNLLKIIDYILFKMKPVKNSWALQLENTLYSKRQKNTSKRDFITHLKQYSDGAFNLIRMIIKGVTIGQIQTRQLLQILTNMDKYSIAVSYTHLTLPTNREV